MTTSNLPPIADDEKLTATMFYTATSMIWGQVLSKQPIRISTWLLTDMAPNYLKLYDAKVLMIGGAQIPAPVKFPVLYLQINNVNAYHLLPPASEPPDYDPDEPNRKMVPTTAMVGHFRFDGLTRMAAFSAADNYLAAAKAAFIPIYDSQMTCPLFPSIKGMKTPMVLLRQHRAMFAMANE
ncbi:MAG TPA: hypothetical protein EYP88_01270 [Anaerolineales bacterium]|nr:hypothetical protein [Anaerolineales bacterium]